MPKKRKQPRKKKSPSDLRRAERRREEHARLVYERQGDPRYVQRTQNPDGSVTIELPDEAAEATRRQREMFVEKFGREPGPDDPVFFDPNADEPRPMTEEAMDWDAIFEFFADQGIDLAFAEAYRELGYIVTEMNEHTFSAHEIEAWEEAVERHRREAELKARSDPRITAILAEFDEVYAEIDAGTRAADCIGFPDILTQGGGEFEGELDGLTIMAAVVDGRITDATIETANGLPVPVAEGSGLHRAMQAWHDDMDDMEAVDLEDED